MKFTKETARPYVGKNLDTEELELRIKVDLPEEGEQDLFFGTGLIDDENPTIEESKQALKDDKNWRDRLIVLDRTSKKGTKYKIALLSNLVVEEVLDL